jgi:4-hydroxyproline epimerase
MDSLDQSSLQVIDSHTGGEPTRVVVEGVPSLGSGDMIARRDALRQQADWVRTSLILEPRGAQWMVGAVLQEPTDPNCTAGVIFFDNAGYIGMCGHGMIGVVTTLAYMQRIEPGAHRFETPAGLVNVELDRDGSVSIENVVSYRLEKQFSIEVPECGVVTGDIAYGGNWFFSEALEQLDLAQIEQYAQRTKRIMHALRVQGVRGNHSETIDHVQLIGPPSDRSKADARSFVLCPGGEYDRSPCGTGTSAKLACLAADGVLEPGDIWRQESILGSVFAASYRQSEAGIVPTISGRAFVTGETTIVFDPQDPFRYGIGSEAAMNPNAGCGKREDA